GQRRLLGQDQLRLFRRQLEVGRERLRLWLGGEEDRLVGDLLDHLRQGRVEVERELFFGGLQLDRELLLDDGDRRRSGALDRRRLRRRLRRSGRFERVAARV